MNKTKYLAYLKVQKTLESLIESHQECRDTQRSLNSRFTEMDTEMSVLWDKVSHSLARIGGRKSKRSADQDEPNDEPRSVDDLNLAIMRGEVTAWP